VEGELGWLGRRQASHTIAHENETSKSGGGACASEATANKPLLQYHSEPMAFLIHQARYYFIVARSRALFELSHCSTVSLALLLPTNRYIQPSRAAIVAIRCSKRNTTQRYYPYLHYHRVCRSRTFFSLRIEIETGE